nr:TRIC cation channel family protein [Cloacibacillus porcorum]
MMSPIASLSVLEIIGVVSFALLGAHTAVQRRMDLFGITILAFTAACGGGVLRDVVIDRGIPVFFSNYQTVLIVMLSVAAVVAVPQLFRVQWLLIVLDAMGLSFFAVDAGIKAIYLHYNFMQFLFAAVITGIGGGILRDLLAQRVPVIFRHDIYALAAIVGCSFLWFARGMIGLGPAAYAALFIILAVRLVSVYFNINLPLVKIAEIRKGGR